MRWETGERDGRPRSREERFRLSRELAQLVEGQKEYLHGGSGVKHWGEVGMRVERLWEASHSG